MLWMLRPPVILALDTTKATSLSGKETLFNGDVDMNKCPQQPAANERTEGEPATSTIINNCQAISTTGIGGPVVTTAPVTSQPPVITRAPNTQPAGLMRARYGQCGKSMVGLIPPTASIPPHAMSVCLKD
ncbi:hypothetical protein BKA70DRAFT_1432743 [Coprinopsis sp. MPI-PUGE-AT-0042]|nr:hypothetical protein BKA70DRAFT_1432743 [Coprinopsis sp. MPI-PUGE-AT-0042]